MAGNFRAARPKAQPRTLRTIAEDKGSSPAGRDAGVPYDAQAGVPEGYPGAAAGQRYEDRADAAKPSGAAKRGQASPKSYK